MPKNVSFEINDKMDLENCLLSLKLQRNSSLFDSMTLSLNITQLISGEHLNAITLHQFLETVQAYTKKLSLTINLVDDSKEGYEFVSHKRCENKRTYY